MTGYNFGAALALAFALPACAAAPPSASEAAYTFSHAVEATPAHAYRSASASVRFLCEGADALACECPCGEPADVYALPGAGDGQPFGVASWVALEACE